MRPIWNVANLDVQLQTQLQNSLGPEAKSLLWDTNFPSLVEGVHSNKQTNMLNPYIQFQERNQTIKEYKKSLSAAGEGEDSEKCKQSRPALPDGTKIISIPVLEMEPEDPNNADENNPLRQKIVKKSKKDWVLNPAGNF